ncbi:glycine--tRNA ligase subunit beta [Rhodocyclus tenuis]|uniref:glycine--tRNA ligase subunit beta n=1 Tax=Rhodocyclus gracilis TaxID=2929842 RepID=UPI001298E563|nr:glycine--tRNA ligase subunit beta [Rhodocyclus gracilis]MRD72766.1 glycine--tRNA ligase subunit beta [Rhodocyclus gracilis]
MNPTLLVELLTEELPPKALARLGEVFAAQIHAGLVERKLVAAGSDYRWFATPRRLAIQVPGVLAVAPDATVVEKIMPVAVALDAAGQPSPALLKKLAAKGIAASEVAKFEKRMDGKSETFFYEASVKGARLDDVLAGIVGDALKKLPIPKLMRWGDSDHQFVRPVHGLVLLHGERVVAGEVLGLTSGRVTRGHRFLSSGEITLASAESYEEALRTQGRVVASFAERRASIEQQLAAQAAALGATINRADGLLDEVTALVEWPVVYVGEFEAEYLEVPQECLILTMQQNQKYFPLLDAAGKLINKFLIVSNMAVADPKHIVGGNARVVRPRLSDARFFFNQDRKATLASRLDRLGSVVYHSKLGSLLSRVDRLEALAQKIAVRLSANASLAARAARLAKADLVTDMVGEFPELQGIMGRYYALHDGEDAAVADAIQSHYQPRFAGDALPAGNIACAAALADKLDALTGFFGIGQIPTGDKDPFGLRRAALGVLRILMESPLPLDLADLIADAQAGFAAGVLTQPVSEPLLDFMLDRLRGLLRDAGYAQDAIEAVLAQRPTRIDRVPARLDAVRDFQRLPEAEALAAANKRIGNILRKADAAAIADPVAALFDAPAEKALFERVVQISPVVDAYVAAEDYAAALKVLAGVRVEVDRFFEDVMVMADDAAVRANRLGLLRALFRELNAVADLSRLAA